VTEKRSNKAPSSSIKEMLGRNVRRFRTERQLTQDELAHLGEFDRSYIGDVERAQHNVTIGSLERIAEGLGLFDCPGILLLSDEDIEWLLSRPKARPSASASKTTAATGRLPKRRR
jgi:transcriptional regulator with XRE-family HTH domain